MSDGMENIVFETEDGEEVTFYIVEETKLGGENYLLVADSEEDEAEAYILKEIVDEDDQIIYEMVDDDDTLEALSKIFAELLEDVDFEV